MADPDAPPSPSPTLAPGQGATGTITEDFERNAWDPVEGVVVPALAPDEVAVMYVQQWAHPERSQAEWLAGLAPYVTARHYEELATVNPANVAKVTVTGTPIEEAMGGDHALFFVPIGEDKYIYLTLLTGGDFWLVDSAEPVG